MTEKGIPFYRDKRVDTLTREELLEAYTHACDELERERQWNRRVGEMQAALSDGQAYRKKHPAPTPQEVDEYIRTGRW